MKESNHPTHQPDQDDTQNDPLPDFIKDRFSRARPGGSALLSISCSSCNHPIMIYQKDGRGDLIRCYLDRVYLPENPLEPLDPSDYQSKSDMIPLSCQSCHAVVGTPMIYESEKRLAYRIIPGTIKKKKVK